MHRIIPSPASLLFVLFVLLGGALAACSSKPAATTPTIATTPAASAAAGTTRITAFAVSAENLNVDRVGLRDGYQKPDGNRDLAFTATIQGPVDAIFLVSTNQKGEPGYGLRADTLIASDEIPAGLGGVIDTGKMTVGIGVTAPNSGRFLNEDNGSIHLGDGVHALALYVPNTATLQAGSYVRMYVRAGGVLVPGPITPY